MEVEDIDRSTIGTTRALIMKVAGKVENNIYLARLKLSYGKHINSKAFCNKIKCFPTLLTTQT